MQYYDLPRLSWRALTWEFMQRGRPGWNLTELMEPDERHPTNFGHRCWPCRPAVLVMKSQHGSVRSLHCNTSTTLSDTVLANSPYVTLLSSCA